MADPHATTAAADTDGALEASVRGPSSRSVLGSRYELHGLLGAGGMGNVYKARDLELDELVAVKVLRPELALDPSVIERFRREVKLARRVTHPNVARVFDIGEQGGERLLTMELVEGESLAAHLEREGAPPVARALDIAKAVAAGVAAAHAAGVIHRDLKPDNVLLGGAGRVLVSDFGIAAARAAGGELRTGSLIGTPAYMAPEQVEGAPIDERTDVYAFGAMLYELFTGARAWVGASVIAVAAARLLRPPPDPRAVRGDLSAELGALILRCMARAPDDRFASMAEVGAALAKVEPAPPVSLFPVIPKEPVGLFHRGYASDKTVAVLPFRNSGSSEDAYVADALTEDLIDLLSTVRGLVVHARGAVLQHAASDRDPREVGRALGADVVVSGTIRRTPGAFRISARVISVADGFQLWARRFDGTDADTLRLNDEVARAVANALTVELGANAARAARGEADAETVDLYLRVRALLQRLYTGDVVELGRLSAELAARAPDDPRVLALLVMSTIRNFGVPANELEALFPRVTTAVERAPMLPDVHVALGMLLSHVGRDAEAIAPLKRALRLASNCTEAHEVLGRLLSECGAEEGPRHLEAALAEEPELEFCRAALGRHHALRGEWDTAMRIGSFPGIVRCAMWQRDKALALELLAKAPTGAAARRPIDEIILLMLNVTAHGTEPEPGFLKAPGAKLRSRAFRAQVRAEVWGALGHVDRSIEALEDAASVSAMMDLAWVDHCPLLDALRGDARFPPLRATIAGRAARIIEAYRARD